VLQENITFNDRYDFFDCLISRASVIVQQWTVQYNCVLERPKWYLHSTSSVFSSEEKKIAYHMLDVRGRNSVARLWFLAATGGPAAGRMWNLLPAWSCTHRKCVLMNRRRVGACMWESVCKTKSRTPRRCHVLHCVDVFHVRTLPPLGNLQTAVEET